MTETQSKTRRFEIKARRDGFRRAGRAWPAKGVIVEDLTDEQIVAVQAEPDLIVTELPAAAETSGQGGSGGYSKTGLVPGDEKTAKPAKPATAKATGAGRGKAAKPAEPKPTKSEKT